MTTLNKATNYDTNESATYYLVNTILLSIIGIRIRDIILLQVIYSISVYDNRRNVKHLVLKFIKCL